MTDRCSPSSGALPSPCLRRGYRRFCSAGSQVLRHSPTSPARACPPFGQRPSRTGLRQEAKAHWRSAGSRACCFSACAGSHDYAGPDSYLRISQLPFLPSSSSLGSRHPDLRFFEAQFTPPTDASGLRFTEHLAMSYAKLEVRIRESLLPFLQGTCTPYNMPVYPGAQRIIANALNKEPTSNDMSASVYKFSPVGRKTRLLGQCPKSRLSGQVTLGSNCCLVVGISRIGSDRRPLSSTFKGAGEGAEGC